MLSLLMAADFCICLSVQGHGDPEYKKIVMRIKTELKESRFSVQLLFGSKRDKESTEVIWQCSGPQGPKAVDFLFALRD